MKISVTELKETTLKAIQSYGYNEDEALAIADILLYAQLRGSNQGVIKLIGAGVPKQLTALPPKIVKETPVSILYNGYTANPMIVMNLVTESAIKKAKQSGVGIVGSFNTSLSTGALGYYVHKIAKQGFIGIAYAAPPLKTTAPFGSNEALFCTNPMAYGIPTDSDPIILDMSTSAITYFGLIEAKTANKKVSLDTGYDREGNSTQDPAEILSGAIKTFGGHKGSGLALIVQIFSAALVQADSFDSESKNWGSLVMAIDPEILTTREAFVAEVSSIVKKIKSVRKAQGVKEIMIPGQQSERLYAQAIQSGEIEIEDNLYNELKKVATRHQS